MNLPETFFNPKQAQMKANHSSKKKQGKKERGKKNSKVEKPGPQCLERNSHGKNSLLSCYQCIFHQAEANLATIQLQNHQNVEKHQFWQKVPGVNG